MKHFLSAAVALTIITTPVLAAAPAASQTEQAVTAQTSGNFERRSKRLQGSWSIEASGDKTFIVFGDDFRAAGGPDLKVFLSPTNLSTVTGKTAVHGSIKIGELKKTKGGQEYEIPLNINLSDYDSVLIHCEQFSVLWGGSDI